MKSWVATSFGCHELTKFLSYIAFEQAFQGFILVFRILIASYCLFITGNIFKFEIGTILFRERRIHRWWDTISGKIKVEKSNINAQRKVRSDAWYEESRFSWRNWSRREIQKSRMRLYYHSFVDRTILGFRSIEELFSALRDEVHRFLFEKVSILQRNISAKNISTTNFAAADDLSDMLIDIDHAILDNERANVRHIIDIADFMTINVFRGIKRIQMRSLKAFF